MPQEYTVEDVYVTGYGISRRRLTSLPISSWFGAGSSGSSDTTAPGVLYAQPSDQSPCGSAEQPEGETPGNVGIIRAKARQLWAEMQVQSRYDDWEWGGFVFQAPNGGYYTSPIVTVESADNIVLSTEHMIPPDCIAVAWVHSHPDNGIDQRFMSQIDIQQRNALANSTRVDNNVLTYIIDLRGADEMREYTRSISSSTHLGPKIEC